MIEYFCRQASVVFLRANKDTNMYRKKSLISKINKRIHKSSESVFVLSDFYDFSQDNDQILRALRRLVCDKILIKISKGIYAKAVRSKITNNYIPAGGLLKAGRRALEKLGVKTFSSSYTSAYSKGVSTQVPTGRLIGVNKRVSRKISFNGVNLQYERII